MSGRVCEKHGEWCPNGVCRWCAPVLTFAADVPSGWYTLRAVDGHDVVVDKKFDVQTGLTMYLPKHDPARCAGCLSGQA